MLQSDIIEKLKAEIKGGIHTDNIYRTVYSTDASAYSERPLGVVYPRDKEDVRKIILFCNQNKIPIIPRAAGTSLAGQVVGNGLVVDVSRHMNSVIEVNESEKWVKVQPGVVLDELNGFLKPYGLFFGPETSTSNRCNIGGMVGNNSCGTHSIVYGSTRDHTLEVKGFLSNGDEVVFNNLTSAEFKDKCKENSLEGDIYRKINEILSSEKNRKEIEKEFPHKNIHRRNTGYALDLLMDSDPFCGNGSSFNMCKLLAGSEGTLFFSTEIKLNLVPLPPKEKGLVCVHLNSLEDAFKANLIALKFNPAAVELMDKTIMDLTKDNITQRKNRFFVQGDPAALLLVELFSDSKEEIEHRAAQMESAMRAEGYGYAYPVLFGKDIGKVWALRKAGLGVLSNMPGDDLPVPVIEDTAVRPEDVPDYMADVKVMLDKYGKECVYYAHIGSGELHLRPVLNMKIPEDVKMFHDIAEDTAAIVKKYKGSFSGEHGDGRLRGEFIPFLVGEHNYSLFKEIKKVFDPHNIFNPGKITDTPSMNTSLRYKESMSEVIKTPVYDWSETLGVVRAAERCNGSGDCRKSHLIGGTMCPSYMGTRDEKNTTRARANMLREFFNGSITADKLGFDEVKEVLDLCLSCKACKSECPSSVDMTKLKAEFLNLYHSKFGVPFRSKVIGALPMLNRTAMMAPRLANAVFRNKLLRKLLASIIGFAPQRELPLLGKTTFTHWYKKHKKHVENGRTVYLFADEFTEYNDSHLGIKTLLLLEKLGYNVIVPKLKQSGRIYLSKGLVKKAKKIINENIFLLKDVINDDTPLIGIEPSAILTFRDEYPDLADSLLKEAADLIARNTYTIEEFLNIENENGNIDNSLFTHENKRVKFHGHCYQKSLSETSYTKNILEIPENYTAEEIPSGCCGMAGAFGYEKEHYDLSMKVGELVLFPEVRKTDEETGIVASGTSCRHHIKHGTDRDAVHPVEVLFEALL
ncbi:MAG: FAD-binding protein [Chlorobi bacterium]|nr:FAD-binding protein [Chlorobiota bacterium]